MGKNAKNADYLKEHVMSMFNDHKEVQKGSVPHSVEQRMKLQKQKEMQTASNSDTTAMRKMRSDSDGFDFDSQIHSNSNISSDPLSPTTPIDAETAAVGRFQVQTQSQSKSPDSVHSK